jgi:hypothetical protein
MGRRGRWAPLLLCSGTDGVHTIDGLCTGQFQTTSAHAYQTHNYQTHIDEEEHIARVNPCAIKPKRGKRSCEGDAEVQSPYGYDTQACRTWQYLDVRRNRWAPLWTRTSAPSTDAAEGQMAQTRIESLRCSDALIHVI